MTIGHRTARRSLLRTAGCALALASTIVATRASSQTAFIHKSGAGREIEVTRIAPNVIQFTVVRDSYVRQLNSIAIINDHDVAIFDSMTRPSSAQLVIDKLRTFTNKPVGLVINSHAHPDHWSGTQAFARAFPGLEVIASERTSQFMHLMAAIWPKRLEGQLAARRLAYEEEKSTGKIADGSPVSPEQLHDNQRDIVDLASLANEQKTLTRIYPTIVYHDQLELTHGGREYKLLELVGDQDGTTVLYLPADHVLMTGDLVSFPIPYVSSLPSRQLAALKTIDALPWKILVPGHGPALRDHLFLRMEIAFLEAAIEGVRREVQGGNGDVESVQKLVTLDELRLQFTGGDTDLEARYSSRVKDVVRFAFQEMTGIGY